MKGVEGEEEEGKISPMCESIGHRPLRGRCPKGKNKKRKKKKNKKEKRKKRKHYSSAAITQQWLQKAKALDYQRHPMPLG